MDDAPVVIEWIRAIWLGFGLFLILFAFWLLDSLKDPIFGVLVSGNLDQHQPLAKLCSVATTLALVCGIEFLLSARRQYQQQGSEDQIRDENVLDGGSRWTKMEVTDTNQALFVPNGSEGHSDRVPILIFAYVGGCYITAFLTIAYLFQFHPSQNEKSDEKSTLAIAWHVLGYILYATIESFGSISVATFWSYTNSTLSLTDAERFYGLIISIAQVGAIGGSSMVSVNYWSKTTLICVVCLIIALEILVMLVYDRRFPPTNSQFADEDPNVVSIENRSGGVVWLSGLYLILRHNYVLLILCASCLYEVSLTCLDYQMKILGWSRFEETKQVGVKFSQFMGLWGQLTNVTSLIFSYLAFPWLIRRVGIRQTLRLFPTLLLLVTIITYGALPGNLAVLFVSMALLKAMTYSIHDPAKELLYLPTSNAIKFRAKFWIDVFGARFAKAIGSSINTYAGSVDRSIQMASVPSLLTAFGLWLACFRVGIEFDRLVVTGKIVGRDDLIPGENAGYATLTAVDDEEFDVSNDAAPAMEMASKLQINSSR
jgi:AAA family ATP:ADP antiporter